MRESETSVSYIIMNYVIVKIKERAKYTTTINLFQRCKSHHTYSNNAIVVRLYHDATLAEVLSCQHYRGFQARYQYPNRHMHQCDEKARLNSFLGELLTHYLLHGRVAKTILPNQTSEQLSIPSGYLPQATTRLLMPSIDWYRLLTDSGEIGDEKDTYLYSWFFKFAAIV